MSGGKFEFDDGGYYIGEWDEGQANGFGVCTGPNNLGKFEGLWNNGAEVSGIYTWPNGMQYHGQWVDGQRNGKGKEVLEHMTYSGEWVFGLKHGSGTVRTGKKPRPCFEGTWKAGLQDGHGCEIYKEGGFYAGQWKEGCRHGYGIRGWAHIDQLQDGAISVKHILAATACRKDRPATISGIEDVFNDVQDQQTGPSDPAVHTAESQKQSMRKTISSPALNRQFTFDDIKMETIPERMQKDTSTVPKKLSSKHRVSVFQMVKNNFKRQDSTSDGSESRENEVYKGSWDGDQRHGFGICFYADGSRFIGPWKENKRHGYGLLIESDGEKCGGKWYNDNLVLMTRRKNFKIPMVRKKIKHSVLAAIEASEKATKKMRLAITRGLAARKIAEDADIIANIAVEDSKKAQEFRQKYTLHPVLEATLTQLSRQNTVSSMESIPSGRSSPKFGSNRGSPNSASPSRKRSVFSLITNEIRKKNSLLPSIAKRSGEHEKLDMDVLHSFEKSAVSESALYAAMDTTIGAGALDPFLSQMVLMQYNDAHTRIAKAFTDKSALAEKMTKLNENVFASTLVPMVINNNETNMDECDANGLCSRSSSISSNSSDSYRSRKSSNLSFGRPSKNSSWHSLPGLGFSKCIGSSPSQSRRSLLHPDDCSKKRRSGVANMSLHSDASVSSDEARFVQIKGKLLTGDEVSYSYVALNTAVEGKDTVVLYTDHPKPKFNSDLSISDKAIVNSSTGLYRTLVGSVPRVLNYTSPTGIPSLDSRDSIDSGTAGDDISSESPTSDIPKKLYKSVPTNLDTYSDHQLEKTSYNTKNERLSKTNGHAINLSLDDKELLHIKKPPSYDELTKQKKFQEIGKEQPSGSAVKVCHRSSSVSQVVIRQPEIRKQTRETQTIETDIPVTKRKVPENDHLKLVTQSVDERKPKFRFTNIAKKFWGSKDSISGRSASIDSGYKHSMSIEDSSQSCNSTSFVHHNHPPIDNLNEEEYGEVPGDAVFSGVMGTTVVTIENDKHRKLQMCAQSSLKKPENATRTSSPSPDAYLTSNDMVFDQNKTIEGSPLVLRKDIQLPAFIDMKDEQTGDKYVDNPQVESLKEYVILNQLHHDKEKTKKITSKTAKSMTWV